MKALEDFHIEQSEIQAGTAAHTYSPSTQAGGGGWRGEEELEFKARLSDTVSSEPDWVT